MNLRVTPVWQTLPSDDPSKGGRVTVTGEAQRCLRVSDKQGNCCRSVPTNFRHQSCIVVQRTESWATSVVFQALFINELRRPLRLRTRWSGVRSEERSDDRPSIARPISPGAPLKTGSFRSHGLHFVPDTLLTFRSKQSARPGRTWLLAYQFLTIDCRIHDRI